MLSPLYDQLKRGTEGLTNHCFLGSEGDSESANQIVTPLLDEKDSSVENVRNWYLSFVYAHMLGNQECWAKQLKSGKGLTDAWCKKAITNGLINKQGIDSSRAGHPIF